MTHVGIKGILFNDLQMIRWQKLTRHKLTQTKAHRQKLTREKLTRQKLIQTKTHISNEKHNSNSNSIHNQ